MPLRGRLYKGFCGESLSSFQVTASIPSTKSLGLKLGFDTNAKISPVSGSIATNAPRKLPYNCSTKYCSLTSTDSTIFLPGTEGELDNVRTGLPPAVIST